MAGCHQGLVPESQSLLTLAGKYSSEIRPTFFLAILYMLVPCWAGVRIFNQSRGPTSYTPDMVSVPTNTRPEL